MLLHKGPLDAVQKHAQAHPAQSIRLEAKGDVDFMEAGAQVRDQPQVEQGLLRQIPDMGATRTGVRSGPKKSFTAVR